jgi:cysteine synthase A
VGLVTARSVERDAVAAMRMPRVVRLGPRLFGAVFPLMKLLPAGFILDAAESRGELGPETVVVETTSGTFGLGLAMRCALQRRPLILVGDPVIDERLRRRLSDLGARVEIVTEPAASGGYQASRLELVHRLRHELPSTFWPDQYGNPDNPRAYAGVAELLAETLGQVDCLVGPVGSGGSMCGTARYLRTVFPSLWTVGVDTHGSILFGLPEGHRALRGLGNGLLPPNLDHRLFDEVHWVGEREAYPATRALHREHALFMGPTSGAAYLVATWLSRRQPDAVVVAMLPDEGHRYQDTVYDDGWLAECGIAADAVPAGGPHMVGGPLQADGGWCGMLWNRRSLAAVRADGGPAG